MNRKTVKKILEDMAFVRFAGSMEEKRCAEYFKNLLEEMQLSPKMESFPITSYRTKKAKLLIDEKEISCTAYGGSENGFAEGELYYLAGADPVSLSKCKGKIVLTDLSVGFKLYDQLVAAGAKGFITHNGTLSDSVREISTREICYQTPEEGRLFAVNIHISDAFEAVKKKSKYAGIIVEQENFVCQSHNLILDIDGKSPETVVICAHYDSTEFSLGAYDNMSSAIGLLYLASYFSRKQNQRRIRLLWCGSEERGLLGSLAYCRMHKNEKENTVLNINLDMIGSVMGEFIAFSCMNEEMEAFLRKFLARHRISGSVRYGIRSSDSNSFLFEGIPAVSFARYAPAGLVKIHTRQDVARAVSEKQILEDMKIISKFTDCIVNTTNLPVPMTISEKIKNDVQSYMERKIEHPKEK